MAYPSRRYKPLAGDSFTERILPYGPPPNEPSPPFTTKTTTPQAIPATSRNKTAKITKISRGTDTFFSPSNPPVEGIAYLRKIVPVADCVEITIVSAFPLPPPVITDIVLKIVTVFAAEYGSMALEERGIALRQLIRTHGIRGRKVKLDIFSVGT